MPGEAPGKAVFTPRDVGLQDLTPLCADTPPSIEGVTSIVVLRVRTPGPEALKLLRKIEGELGVAAQPQTAGFVPISVAAPDYKEAIERVTHVLDETDPSWSEHLELRA